MKMIHIISEPVKKNDGEKHSSLEVGNVGSKIHVSAEKNKYEEAFQESSDKYDEMFWNIMTPLPDENNAGAISMQISKSVKSYFLLNCCTVPIN